MSIFPMIQPQIYANVVEKKLYKEIKWDFEKNVPIFHNGSPFIVSGKEAVVVWAWKALQTPRFIHEIYTWNYGCEIESLIGQPFTEELKISEASRYVRECLKINPYITEVSNIAVSFFGGVLSVGCVIETIYGEAHINV